MSGCLQPSGDDVLVRVKAVPGASCSEIAGLVGDRLKVRVSAPPEGGKANKAICGVIARALGIPVRRISIERGAGAPEKTVRIEACTEDEVRALV